MEIVLRRDWLMGGSVIMAGARLAINERDGRRLLQRGVAQEAGRIESSGGGLGCVLLRRRVLEAIDFRLDRSGHCDMPFNRDVLAAGYSQWADLGVVCGHKDADGRVWRPAWETRSECDG